MGLPESDPLMTPGDIAAFALLDLRARLVAIAKLDPSNTGTDNHDEERYAHRNVLVVQALADAMAAGLPCGIQHECPAQPDGFIPDESSWPVIYVQLPNGKQLSWHVPPYPGQYDGHTTAEKYAAIREFDEAFRGIPPTY